MKRLIFISLFVVSLPAIYCQQSYYIMGKIIDSKTSVPVPYATIRLKNSQIGIISNAEGDFRILSNPVFQADSMMVSCIGYHRLSLAFRDLKPTGMNNLKLIPNTYSLKEVNVTARKKRLDSKFIIARALSHIKKNYPVTPFSYVSYYRDYQKDSSNYLNLNEALIQTLDKGFEYVADSNRYRLLQFRKNTDFKQVKVTPYYDIPGSAHSDISFKQMPEAYVGDHNGNELFVLLTHDAIRNFDQRAFFFINNLTTEFLKNHIFFNPAGVYDGNTLLYKIKFEAKPILEGDTYQAGGSIFIQPRDYSIHRLEYSASCFDKGKKKKNIFNIEIEYGYEPTLASKMCLKYISFNNAFIIPDSTDTDYFKIVSGSWIRKDQYKDMMSDLTTLIIFNNNIDSVSAQDRRNYDITIRGIKARISKIEVSGRNLYLTINNDKFNVVTDSCRINIINLKDINGNIFNMQRNREVRQFRELFVQEYNKPLEFQDTCFIQPAPLEKNCISDSKNLNRFWMNTPLKAEEKQ
jgi:hypothetical protein